MTAAEKRVGGDSGLGHTRRYRLGRRIGVGGMAEVFAGIATGAGLFERAVVVKRVLPAYANDPSFAANFMEEARLSGLLSHPNIVAVLDFDQDEKGELFLVMEYVDGVSLSELAQTGPVPFSVAAYVASETLSALGHAHALPASGRVRGLVHRDVTMRNILLSGEGAVKLADFGIAKALSAGTASVSVPIKGTVGYSSPEKLEGRDLDGRSDLFSLGVVLWELLAWQPLFQGSPAEVMTQILFKDTPRPNARRGGIPADLEAVAMKLLARDPAERYQTAGMAIADLSTCEAMPRNGRRCLAEVITERFTRSPGPHGRWQPRPGYQPEKPCPPEAVPRREATVSTPPDQVPVQELGLIAAPGVPDAEPIAAPEEMPQEAPPQEAPPFSFDEYINLIDAMERSPRPGRSRNVALVHALFHLGLSPEVLSDLEIEQLDLDARAFLHVKVAEGSEPRTVPFNDLVTEALERYMEDRRAFLQGAGRSALFLTKRGRHLSARDLQALMRHHLERVGRSEAARPADASGVPRAELGAVGSFAVSETPAMRALGELDELRRERNA